MVTTRRTAANDRRTLECHRFETGRRLPPPSVTFTKTLSVKFLFDLLPVILFFATFKIGQGNADALAGFIQSVLGGGLDPEQAPVLAATFVAIIASIIQVAFVLARGKKPEPMLWISLAIIVVFGSLTLILHDATFIKVKPTILYWVFSALLVFAHATNRNFIRKILGEQIELSCAAWRTLQLAWLGFFFITGALNLLVAFTCETETWVNFKLFGILGLTLAFTVAMGFWIAKTTGQLEKAVNKRSTPDDSH